MDINNLTVRICPDCSSQVETKNAAIQRHKAPCGTVCFCGIFNSTETNIDIVSFHRAPENVHDVHYHGTCPAGCFDDCCNPPHNKCGVFCEQCRKVETN